MSQFLSIVALISASVTRRAKGDGLVGGLQLFGKYGLAVWLNHFG